MKNWLGIVVFLAMVIVNIILEQQKKVRLDQEEGDSEKQKLPPPSQPGYPKQSSSPVPPAKSLQETAPSGKTDSLQDLLQELFQRNSANLPEGDENVAEILPAQTAPVSSAPVAADQISPPKSALATVLPVIRAVAESKSSSASPTQPAVPPAPPAPPAIRTPVQKAPAIRGSIIARNRSGLRQAVVMAEVLGKPKAWQ